MKVIRDAGAAVGEVHGQLRDADGATFLSSAAQTVSNGLLRFHTDRRDVEDFVRRLEAAAAMPT